jgi:hypothetical protein
MPHVQKRFDTFFGHTLIFFTFSWLFHSLSYQKDRVEYGTLGIIAQILLCEFTNKKDCRGKPEPIGETPESKQLLK